MEGKTTSIVEKGLDPRRVMLGTIIPYWLIDSVGVHVACD